MPAAHRSRRYGIVAASLAVHAALVALVAVQTPRLPIPAVASGPPEAIIPVLILPRTPPPAAAPGAKPTPIRLHRRPQRFVNEDLPVAPLIAPTKEEAPERPAPAPGPKTVVAPGQDDALAANARNALRGKLDCNNPRLTRAEREACMERFAAGARDAPFLGLGVDRDKASDLARAAARREADYNYKRGQGGVGVSGTGHNAGAIAQPGAPNLGMGATAEDLGRSLGNDRPAAKVPF